MKNSNNSTMFGIGTLPPPPPPPEDLKGEDVKNVVTKEDLPPPPPPPKENSEEIAHARTMISNLDLDAIESNRPTNKIRKDVASKVSNVSSVTHTVSFGNPEVEEQVNKSKLSEDLANLPITYSGNSAPKWMGKFIDKKPATKQKPLSIPEQEELEPSQSISETLKDRVEKDYKMKVPISEIYEKIIKPKLATIDGVNAKKQYINQCDKFLKANIEEKFTTYKTKLENLAKSQEDPTLILRNLAPLLQTMFEGRVFSKATRRHILKQAIDLIQIVKVEVKNENIDIGTGKYLKNEIADALGHAMTMARYNKDKKTTLSPSTGNLTALIDKFPGEQEVGIKGALTFPHADREDPDDILALNNDIENIIQNPKDPSYKDAADKLECIVKRAQNFTLLGDQLVEIRNFGDLQNAIDKFSDEWRKMLEIIKEPGNLAFFLSRKQVAQYHEFEKIQTVILEKIIKPQMIVLSELLLSDSLFIPENITDDLNLRR